MKQRRMKGIVVLAIFPSRIGFGFAVFRGPWVPLDWGQRRVRGTKRGKNKQSLAQVSEIIEWYRPDVIVLEDYAGEGSRRTKRIQELIQDIDALAAEKKIRTYSYSRALIRECFSEFGAWTKQEIAGAIAESLPVFASLVPPVRKIWMAEHPRMNVFDAVSLALTFFYFDNRKKKVA